MLDDKWLSTICIPKTSILKIRSLTIVIVQTKKNRNQKLVINDKSYKDLVIYFIRYDCGKAITILSLYYHELMGKIEEHEGKKYLMVDDYLLIKVLDGIKKIISMEEFDNTKILIDTDDILPVDMALKNAVLLRTFTFSINDSVA